MGKPRATEEDEREFVVTIGRYRGFQMVEALILETPGGGTRLTGGDAGPWTHIKDYRCRIKLSDLKEAHAATL